MPLYKYLEPDRVDVIEHLRIRFTPANDFNDPFECLSDSHLIEHPGWQRQIEDACVRELLAEDAVNAAMHGHPPQWTEAGIRQLHRERYAARLPEMKNLARDTLKAAREPFRILCLSQVPPDSRDAFLLWGHYTRSHYGLVVEFDPANAWIKEHEPVPEKPHDCGPVIYADVRPSWDADERGNAQPRREFIFTKSTHWRYEKEFRLVRFAGTPGVDASVVDSLISFPPLALRSVIFGVNTALPIKQRVVTACQRPELSHVRFREAQVHPDTYQLTLAELR